MIRSRQINLANSGLKNGPLRGHIIGPFQSVRSTTVPWSFRHLLGSQINGAPEPLVYSPVYKFVPSEKIPQPPWQDMFKQPGQFGMEFQVPNIPNTRTFNVQGNGSPNAASPSVAPSMFSTMAPQPPPFVPPVPPDPSLIPKVDAGASSGPPTEPGGQGAPPGAAPGVTFLEEAFSISRTKRLRG